VLPLGPQVEQLDLLRCHTGLVGETLDDSAGRNKMWVGVGRKRDGETTYLTGRSEPIRNQHVVSISLSPPISSLALFALHPDTLMGAPAADLGHAGLVHRLDAHVGGLAAGCRVRTSDHLPFAALIGEPITELEIHGQDTDFSGSLLLGR